ncbi:MAG: aldolase/citrate lyase family protein [Pirellulales bacterium]
MMFDNRVKRLLREGRAAWGVTLPDASNVMAKASINAGIDFLWVDLEHRPFEVDAVTWVPILCRQKNCACVVRVSGLSPQLAKKALDIGANGVMFPQINTPEEARLAVEYCKYPPQGSRGISPQWTHMMDVAWSDYLPAANDETCVIVQVETPEGIKNLDAIAAVQGVDIVFAGPNDLAASLGFIGNNKHPEVQAYLADFPGRVAAQGKAAGVTFADIEACRQAYQQGYRFISFGTILLHGSRGIESELTRFRALEKTP